MTFKSLLPTIVLILTAVGGALAPQIQAAVAAHPTLFLGLSSIIGVVLHWLPAPNTPAA
jgi:hypothetical protein